MRALKAACYLVIVVAICVTLDAARLEPSAVALGGKVKKFHPYTSPEGLFIQERASKQLPGPGQHFSFGALKPWEDIVAMLQGNRNRKLALVVRHGQAISNYLSDTLGPDKWYQVEGTCKYDDNGTVWHLFDADLTDMGTEQAKSLNSILNGGGWYQKLTGGLPVRAVVSPLTRCLHTADLVLDGLALNATNVEEYVRETLGEDTCDARRSVSDPDPDHPKDLQGPCPFENGLASKFPHYRYPVYDPKQQERGLGLVGDGDHLWTKTKRERQGHQVKRAKKFLDILFDHVKEQVVVIVTHSGFTRSLLLAVRREPYRPVNAELVPVVIDRTPARGPTGEDVSVSELAEEW